MKALTWRIALVLAIGLFVAGVVAMFVVDPRPTWARDLVTMSMFLSLIAAALRGTLGRSAPTDSR